jgi:hypothetical protein
MAEIAKAAAAIQLEAQQLAWAEADGATLSVRRDQLVQT